MLAKGFDTLWNLPKNMVGIRWIRFLHDRRLRSNVMDELETAFERDVVERTTFLMHTINVEIKYKLSDLNVALNNPPNQLPVTRYILRWIQANWSSVDGQLVRNDDYR
jgi:hypothetical protein